MKVKEKTIDSTTCLRMKSGAKVDLHVITHNNGIKSLVIEKDNKKLIFGQEEMSEFVNLFNEFLTSI